MREKLIELLTDMPSGHRTYEETERYAEDMADYLIANGVTIGEDNNAPNKWILVKDRLPEDEKKVLCILDDGFFCILEWRSWDWLWNDGHNVYAEKDVTHWMPLPEAPKGE